MEDYKKSGVVNIGFKHKQINETEMHVMKVGRIQRYNSFHLLQFHMQQVFNSRKLRSDSLLGFFEVS